MNLWKDMPAGADAPDSINVIVEIPKGSRNKYEFDKKTGALKLDRVLYSSIHYPVVNGKRVRPVCFPDENIW